MARQTENKIILVHRKTRLEELIARHNTVEQARFYLETLGTDISDYQREHAHYQQVLRQAEGILSALGRLQLVSRDYISRFSFGPDDVVVVVGQDGLVANTLKYLDRQPLIGVNPDPARWDGALLPFTVSDLGTLLPDVFARKCRINPVTMAKAALNDGQVLYAVNDLFIGQRSHVSSRYHIRHGARQESQSSSGVIISTGLGASGWLKGIVAGASGILSAFGGEYASPIPFIEPDWNADYLHFTVREPFPSRCSQASIVFGKITHNQPMSILSQMPEDGVIFSDGIESDFLEFRSGVEAVISVAEKKGYLVV